MVSVFERLLNVMAFLQCSTGQSMSLCYSWKTNDVITLRKAFNEGRDIFCKWVSAIIKILKYFPCSTEVRTGSHGTDREGTKTGGGLLTLLLHHCREKTYIPGNLPLPDSSLLTPVKPAVLIPDWLGSLSGLEHGHKGERRGWQTSQLFRTDPN